MAMATVVILGLSVLVMITRYYATADRSRPLYLLIADPFGFLAAFSQWFTVEGWRVSDFFAGHRTFERLFALFGSQLERAHTVDVGFTTSNIFTMFRGMIEDFGTLGALAGCFLGGVVGGVSHRQVIQGKQGAVPILIVVYATILVSLSYSIFFYTTVTLAIALLFACFILVWLLRIENPGAVRTGTSVLDAEAVT